MGYKHYQTVETPPPYQPGALFGAVWCPSTNYSLQISIFQIHQIFNFIIFLNLNYHLRKKISLSQNAQNHPKIYTKPPNSG